MFAHTQMKEMLFLEEHPDWEEGIEDGVRIGYIVPKEYNPTQEKIGQTPIFASILPITVRLKLKTICDKVLIPYKGKLYVEAYSKTDLWFLVPADWFGNRFTIYI
jgi:hypothetical protein